MLAGLSEQRRERPAHFLNFPPVGLRNTNSGVWGAKSGLRQNDYAGRDEPRKHGSGQMLSHLVQTQPASLTLRVAAVGPHRREVIIAKDDGGLVEVRAPFSVGRDDQ